MIYSLKFVLRKTLQTAAGQHPRPSLADLGAGHIPGPRIASAGLTLEAVARVACLHPVLVMHPNCVGWLRLQGWLLLLLPCLHCLRLQVQ